MKNLLLFIGLCLSSCVYAQGEDHILEKKESTLSSKKIETLPLLPLPNNISIEDGPELDKYKKRDETEILLHDFSGFYGVSTLSSVFLLKKSVYFFHCDDNMNLIKGEEVEFSADGERMHLLTIKVMKGAIYILGVRINFPEKKVSLYMQSVNKNTLLLNNDLKKITELNYYDYSSSVRSMIYSSKDESKLLICCENSSTRTDSKASFSAIVLDNNLNQLWERSITLPCSGSLYFNQNILIDNDGTVYFHGILYNSEGQKIDSNGMPNYSQVISFCKGGSDEIGEFRMPNAGKFISNISIMPMSNGELICTGLYKEKLNLRNTTGFKGIYYLRANVETKEIKVETYNEVEEKKIENGGLFGINVESDGSLILLKENLSGGFSTSTVTQTMDVSTPSMSPGTAVVSTTSTVPSGSAHAGDILVVKIKSEGVVEWATNIAKFEKAPDNRYLSSAYLIAKGKTYLVYNDHPKNLTRKEEVKRSNGAIVTLVEINTDGTYNKYQLYSNEESNTRPSVSKSVGENQLILYRDHSSKFKYTRLTFK